MDGGKLITSDLHLDASLVQFLATKPFMFCEYLFPASCHPILDRPILNLGCCKHFKWQTQFHLGQCKYAEPEPKSLSIFSLSLSLSISLPPSPPPSLPLLLVTNVSSCADAADRVQVHQRDCLVRQLRSVPKTTRPHPCTLTRVPRPQETAPS